MLSTIFYVPQPEATIAQWYRIGQHHILPSRIQASFKKEPESTPDFQYFGLVLLAKFSIRCMKKKKELIFWCRRPHSFHKFLPLSNFTQDWAGLMWNSINLSETSISYSHSINDCPVDVWRKQNDQYDTRTTFRSTIILTLALQKLKPLFVHTQKLWRTVAATISGSIFSSVWIQTPTLMI